MPRNVETAAVGSPGKGAVRGGWHRGPQEKGKCRRRKAHLMTDAHPRTNVRGQLWRSRAEVAVAPTNPGDRRGRTWSAWRRRVRGFSAVRRTQSVCHRLSVSPEGSYHTSVRNVSADTCFQRTEYFSVLDTRAGAVCPIIGQTHLSTQYFGLP